MMLHALHGLTAGELWSPRRLSGPQTLIFAHGKIKSINFAHGKISGVEPGDQPLAEGQGLDASDALVVPGLVDLQVNGALGHSFQANDQPAYGEITSYHLRHGTTTLLPTVITAPPESLQASLAALAAFARSTGSPTIPGIHLEGPFLSPERSGAHDPAALRVPDLEFIRQLDAAAAGLLKIVTLAPELPGSVEAIRWLSGQGILVSAGHTTATYRQIQAGVAAGLRLLTHMGNASDWPHRAPQELGFLGSEPGLVGSFMAIPELCGSIILDGFHFHPALLKPLVDLKGPESIALVSDASTVTGLPPGEYASGGLIAQIHPEGFATSGRGGGWLAGSLITLLEAVQRAVRLAGIPLDQALTMAAVTPARLLGLQGQKGELRPGADADLLVLNRDLSLRHVISQGYLMV